MMMKLLRRKRQKKYWNKQAGYWSSLRTMEKDWSVLEKAGKNSNLIPTAFLQQRVVLKTYIFLNKTVTPEAMSSVKAFSAFILKKIPKAVVTLVAVHNNQNGNYSINSYKSGTHSKNVLKWYKNPKRDPDNFFIVNNNEMFKRIKKQGFNAVLQNSVNAIDDGSLSIYYGKKNLVYVNIETEKGNLDEQVEMLNVVFNILK